MSEWEINGQCCLCNRPVTLKDWQAQKVVAAGPGLTGRFVAACADHFFVNGKQTYGYQDFMNDFARAVCKNMGWKEA